VKPAVAVALCFALAALPAWGDPDPRLLEKLRGVVVKVESVTDAGRVYAGSGVALAADTVATACHTIEGGEIVRVLQGGDWYRVRALQRDSEHDVCLLKLDPVLPRWATFAQAPLRVGQAVLALGYSGGLRMRFSEGMITALYAYDGERVIRSDARFNLGASGGGLFDRDANLVGLISFFLPNSPIHFAAPVAWIRRAAALYPSTVQAGSEGSPSPAEEWPAAYWQRPRAELPWFLQLAALERRRDWDRAVSVAEAWVANEPKEVEAHVALAFALAHQEQDAAALMALDRALEIDAEHAGATQLRRRLVTPGADLEDEVRPIDRRTRRVIRPEDGWPVMREQ
jgi:hypothetical protein